MNQFIEFTNSMQMVMDQNHILLKKIAVNIHVIENKNQFYIFEMAKTLFAKEIEIEENKTSTHTCHMVLKQQKFD